MSELKILDEVAYIRFASVYKTFKDVSEFVADLSERNLQPSEHNSQQKRTTSMKSRRKAREVALQVLFQKSFCEDQDTRNLFHIFADHFQFDSETKDYALFLTDGVTKKKRSQSINSLWKKSNHWNLDRIAVIDKILLQIAILELCFSDQTQTAPKLILTDIIDLAKKV